MTWLIGLLVPRSRFIAIWGLGSWKLSMKMPWPSSSPFEGSAMNGRKKIDVTYKDVPVGEGRLDFLVSGCLIVELKAVEGFASIHKAQVLSYLKATRLRLGLLINFNVPILKEGLQRVILS
jgi:hypothetical protein